ncbi:hypothetical protein [Aquisphaera insulae]|uniref:hypothetical protein n=1 Tax=Aquisphaera insulae TaxID=2712864 RepID=UPI0013EA4D8F|nr:hypothetical protein [Aquisphaera insulae]
MTGHLGSGSELAGGFNRFVLKGRDNPRDTRGPAWLEHSPDGQDRAGNVAGRAGILMRTRATVLC